jgi:hypothetical protein
MILVMKIYHPHHHLNNLLFILLRVPLIFLTLFILVISLKFVDEFLGSRQVCQTIINWSHEKREVFSVKNAIHFSQEAQVFAYFGSKIIIFTIYLQLDFFFKYLPPFTFFGLVFQHIFDSSEQLNIGLFDVCEFKSVFGLHTISLCRFAAEGVQIRYESCGVEVSVLGFNDGFGLEDRLYYVLLLVCNFDDLL